MRRFLSSTLRARAAIRSFNSSTFSPVTALTQSSSRPGAGRSSGLSRSALVRAMRKGTALSFRRASSLWSCSESGRRASAARTAASVSARMRSVLSTRRAPSAPSSSSPGVSMMSTGPRGRSSIAFLTGSVVVPPTSETMERSCPVTALTRLDLPAFRTPKKAT